ncbi:MAG: ATPase domain-containing protein, partial [Candidatus Thermoplasmatota archaeon]|nr:ATPase domain-containing protein [Candidatus Thermoplasmatota archaeon]
GSCVLIYSAPFAGAEIFMNRFIAEGLCKGVPCVVVTVDRSADDLRQELKDFIEGYEQAEKAKLISYVDIYSKRMGMIFERRDNVEYVPTFKDVDLINLAVNETLNRVKEKSGYCRVVFPLSTLATSLKAQELFRLIGDLTTKCRRKKAVALYSLTKGIYSNNEVQVIRNLTDGVIELKEDNQRTFLAVQGMCDVQTRAWVEYKAKGKDLIIGSFHLDYIR